MKNNRDSNTIVAKLLIKHHIPDQNENQQTLNLSENKIDSRYSRLSVRSNTNRVKINGFQPQNRRFDFMNIKNFVLRCLVLVLGIAKGSVYVEAKNARG